HRGRCSHQECATTLRMRSASGHRTRGCRINRRLVFLPRSLQTQFFYSRCKRARLDCKQLRGSAVAVHFPPCFVQRRQNISPLGVTYFFLGAHLNQYRIREPLWLEGGIPGGGQLKEDWAVASSDDGSFHNVLQLPHVSWPVIFFQGS